MHEKNIIKPSAVVTYSSSNVVQYKLIKRHNYTSYGSLIFTWCAKNFFPKNSSMRTLIWLERNYLVIIISIPIAKKQMYCNVKLNHRENTF